MKSVKSNIEERLQEACRELSKLVAPVLLTKDEDPANLTIITWTYSYGGVRIAEFSYTTPRVNGIMHGWGLLRSESLRASGHTARLYLLCEDWLTRKVFGGDDADDLPDLEASIKAWDDVPELEARPQCYNCHMINAQATAAEYIGKLAVGWKFLCRVCATHLSNSAGRPTRVLRIGEV